MLRPAISDLLGSKDSRYSLVIATAKIARKIAEYAEIHKEPLEDKPVSIAVDLLSKGKYNIIYPKDVHQEENHDEQIEDKVIEEELLELHENDNEE